MRVTAPSGILTWPWRGAILVVATIVMLTGSAGATTIQDVLGPARTSAGVGFNFPSSVLNFGDGHDTVGGNSGATASRNEAPFQDYVGQASANLFPGSFVGAGVNYLVTGNNPQLLPSDATASALLLNYVTVTALP